MIDISRTLTMICYMLLIVYTFSTFPNSTIVIWLLRAFIKLCAFETGLAKAKFKFTIILIIKITNLTNQIFS